MQQSPVKVDKHRPQSFKPVYDLLIVNDSAAHIDRGAMLLQRAFYRLDRALDTGAEPARIGEQHPPFGLSVHCVCFSQSNLWHAPCPAPTMHRADQAE